MSLRRGLCGFRRLPALCCYLCVTGHLLAFWASGLGDLCPMKYRGGTSIPLMTPIHWV